MAKKAKKAPAAVHPGEALREEFLKPLGMSANRLAIELRIPAPRISEVVRERRAVTAETALRLARFFRTTPDFWMNLQTAYDLRTAQYRVGTTIEAEVSPRAA